MELDVDSILDQMEQETPSFSPQPVRCEAPEYIIPVTQSSPAVRSDFDAVLDELDQFNFGSVELPPPRPTETRPTAAPLMPSDARMTADLVSAALSALPVYDPGSIDRHFHLLTSPRPDLLQSLPDPTPPTEDEPRRTPPPTLFSQVEPDTMAERAADASPPPYALVQPVVVEALVHSAEERSDDDHEEGASFVAAEEALPADNRRSVPDVDVPMPKTVDVEGAEEAMEEEPVVQAAEAREEAAAALSARLADVILCDALDELSSSFEEAAVEEAEEPGDWDMGASARPVGFGVHVTEDISDTELDAYLQEEDEEEATPKGDVSRSSSTSSVRRVRFADEVPVEEHNISEFPIPSASEQETAVPAAAANAAESEVFDEPTLPPAEQEDAAPSPVPPHDTNETSTAGLPPPYSETPSEADASAQPEDVPVIVPESLPQVAEEGDYVDLELPSSAQIVREGMAGLEDDAVVTPRQLEEVFPGARGDGDESSEAPGGPEEADARPSALASTHIFGPTLESFRLTQSELQLGKAKPQWIPDAEAPNCMLCQAKFTVIHRRHHCRACGRVLCGGCCGRKASLPYLEAAEGEKPIQRVCEPCSNTLQRQSGVPVLRILEFEREAAAAEEAQLAVALGFGPADEEPRGLLRPPDVAGTGRRVTFGDGVRPGAAPSPEPRAAEQATASASADVAGTSDESASSRRGRRVSSARRQSRAAAASIAELESFLGGESGLGPPPSLSPDAPDAGFDWPLIVAEGMRNRGTPERLMSQMEDPDAPPVEFAIKRNLTANVKLLKLDCCSGSWVWALSSVGLRCVAQDEVLILVERAEGERRPPFDVLRLFNALYEEALQGARVSEMEHVVVAAISGLHFGPAGFLGSQDHAGILFIRPSLQCLEGGLPLPDKPFLVGLLLLRSEVPWAKVLPMRVLLRLGAAAKVYPCPLVSVRNRAPLYGEIGQTIMNLLADFRNYSYSLPWIQGSRVHLEDQKTTITIPKSKLRMMVRAISASRQAGSVVAWATDFSPAADSHLVAIQAEAAYKTQTINIQGRQRKVTGASFVVMNGALRTTSAGVEAKSSIVEDGLMLQVRPDEMDALVAKLKNGEDYSINIDNAEQGPMLFEIKWTEESGSFKNRGYRSPVDGKKLEGLPCLKVSGKIADHSSGAQLLRMTELFVLNSDIPLERLEELQGELLTLGRHLSSAAAKALLPFAGELAQSGLRSLGIRVTLGPELVEFTSGAGGQTLPEPLVPGLDAELVPLLYAKAPAQSATITLELILRILDL